MSLYDLRMLERATRIATDRDPRHGNYWFGVVARRPDGLIVESYNVTNMGPKPQPKGHAEWRISSKLQSGSDIYIARVFKNGLWADAKPCDNCMMVLRNRRVRFVFYTKAGDEYGVLLLTPAKVAHARSFKISVRRR